MTKEKAKIPKMAVQKPRLVIRQDMDVVYSNMARIAHTPAEFILDFARRLPGEPNIPVLSRVMMSPLGAKLLIKALEDNIQRFEEQYGEIKIPTKMSLADQLFKPIQDPDDEDQADGESGEDE